MSNWEKRPLRLSQQHYAALDAYCLIPILLEIAKIGAAKNEVSAEEHIRQNIYPLKYKDPKNGGFSWNEESKDDQQATNQGYQNAIDNKKYRKNKKRTEQRRANKHN
jgi:ribonuclease D